MYEVKWMPKTAAELEELCNKAVEHGFKLVACNDKFCVFESAQLERAPVHQATAKATAEDVIEIVEPYIVKQKDFEEVSRLLRERLGGG